MKLLRYLLTIMMLNAVAGCVTVTTQPLPTTPVPTTSPKTKSTAVPVQPSLTASTTSAPLSTPVPTPTFDMDTFFRPVDVKDLQANPKKYENDAFRFTGRVFHIQREGNRTYFQVLTDPGEVNIRAIAVNEGQDMQVGDLVTVYAAGFGTSEGISPSGETVTVPTVEVVKIVAGRR